MKWGAWALALLSFSASAELLKCHSDGYNPSYEITLDKTPGTQVMTLNLTSVIVGFAATDRRSLGTDPLELRLNPSTCQAEIVSLNNSVSEFKMSLNLRGPSSAVSGRLSGSITDARQVRCQGTSDELVNSLRDVCDNEASLDQWLVFHKTTDVIHELDRVSPVMDSDREEGEGSGSFEESESRGASLN